MLSVLNPYGPVRVHAEATPPVLHLHLAGELDLAGERSLEVCERLDLDGYASVVVHLERLRFVDSAGVDAFGDFCDHQNAAGRTVSLVGSRSAVRRVFTVMGQDRYLTERRPA